MKSHLLLAFKHVTWAAFGSWFLRNPNTLLQNLSEKNVLKEKKTLNLNGNIQLLQIFINYSFWHANWNAKFLRTWIPQIPQIPQLIG